MSYYDVGGAAPEDIRAELDRKRSNGWDGHTTWRVNWRFSYAASDAGCRITEVATSVAVNYSLPRWLAPESASRETSDAWARYARALKAHEDGHRNIGVGVANEIDRTLRSMHAPDCRELEARANGAATGSSRQRGCVSGITTFRAGTVPRRARGFPDIAC